MSTKKNKQPAPVTKPESNTQPPAFDPSSALDEHLRTATGIAKALYGASTLSVLNGRLAYFNSPASGIEVDA